MIDYNLLIATAAGIIFLLLLVLRFRMQAFLALLMASILTGILAGMPPPDIIETMKEGMGNTLGFVAVVVGLGAMFGAILEHSGGAESLARYLLGISGEKNASWALMLTGFCVAIPVFFDVAFIILVPLIYALQRKTGKSLLLYAIPLLAGLAITHTFIPPTPGPVAVADILDADLGWVILAGLMTGIPTAIVCGPLFGKYIAKRIFIEAPSIEHESEQNNNFPHPFMIISIIFIPILLILASTILSSPLSAHLNIGEIPLNWINLAGHPFSALIIANLIAWYLLGIRRGYTKSQLMLISTKSMEPAGIIILLTGAGGVFKQMLINTGTGEMLASYFAEQGLGILIFAFISASIIRILQGSATVAMITAAGLTSPLISADISDFNKALIVIAIASGSSILSHVNDSGFWLVSKYLGLDEKQTFKSWTTMTTILAICGFITVGIISIFT